MTECTGIDALITREVDEALTPSEHAELERHAAGCAACRGRLLAERAARQVLRRHAPALKAVAMPEALRQRLGAAASASHAPVAAVGRGRSVRDRLVRAALAASLVIGLGLGLTAVVTRQSTTVLAAQLAADHVKCFLTSQDHGVLEPQPVAEYLRARYGFHAKVPAADAALGLRLIGARRCLSGEGTNAHLLYTWRGAPVSLYLLPGGTHAPQGRDVLGHAAEIWAGQNGTYVLVMPDGARPAPLVEYMQQATR